MKKIEVPFENAILAETHKSQYLMHKYWARKPANVVSEYIKYFTNENDVVLDPFAGSGVTAIEAANLGIKAIFNDLSPTSIFIAKNTSLNVNLKSLTKKFQEIYDAVFSEINQFYQTPCSDCGSPSYITHTIWIKEEISDKERMHVIKTTCPHCGYKEERKPNESDHITWNTVKKTEIPYWFPQNEMIANGRLLVKKGMKVSDLFNKRGLLVLSTIWEKISLLEDNDIKELLKFVFTSTLAQASKLVPVYSKKGRENQVGGWTMPGFWIPKKYCEVNALNCFNERFKKVKRGKESGNNKFENITWCNESAFNLDSIKDNSIDYIFTDPPYGDSVPYFEYHIIWGSWLKHKFDFENEIVISDAPERGKDIENYKYLFQKTFRELYRVLKSGAWMTITFHNSHINVWNALISSVLDSGFVYGNDCYVLTGRKSSNQLLRKGGSMTGDIYINFNKPLVSQPHIPKDLAIAKKEIFEESEKIIIERGGLATTDQLALGILMKLSKHNLFGKVLDLKITDILNEQFDYDIDTEVWTIRGNKEAKLIEFIPLNTRISTVIDNVLSKEKAGGFSLDEFLVPIFTKFKNGRTPDATEIRKILEKKAYLKNGKWHSNQQQSLFDSDILIKDYIDPTEKIKIETEHNAIIYQLAKIGLNQDYQIWVGDNEKRKTPELIKISIKELKIPGITQEAIKESRINQIDLIWLKPEKGEYLLFEVENSTRMINCIPRLANLTEKLPFLRIPIYIVIPDTLYNKAISSFNDPSNKKLIESDRFIILYSKFLDNLDLLDNKRLDVKNFIEAVSEKVSEE